jgi:hypothetical protein
MQRGVLFDLSRAAYFQTPLVFCYVLRTQHRLGSHCFFLHVFSKTILTELGWKNSHFFDFVPRNVSPATKQKITSLFVGNHHQSVFSFSVMIHHTIGGPSICWSNSSFVHSWILSGIVVNPCRFHAGGVIIRRIGTPPGRASAK